MSMTPCDCLEIYEDAVFYDLEFASRDFEIPFFLRHARAAAGPVLEVACGTGRITLPVARAGVDITGSDISAPMLEQARRKSAAENLLIEWREEDCRIMRPGREFALIFSATNAMQHLLDVESVCAFLRSARRALTPDGQVIIDVFNPDPAKLLRPASDRYMHKTITTPGGGAIRVETSSHYLPDAQILHFDLFYHDGATDELLRTKSVNMRCFFPQELLALCHLNGLRVMHRFGDYDESPFTAASPKQLLICQATPGSSLL